MIKIASASVYLIQWPFTRPVQHSLARHDSTSNLIVKLTDETGLCGFGEGVPRDYVTGETVEAALDALRDSLLPGLVGRSFELDEVLGFLSRVFEEDVLDACPAAVCAAELALLDLAGRFFDLSVGRMLGPAGGNELTYSAVIPLTTLDQLQEILGLVQSLGLSQVKIKVGRDDDLERVAFIRKVLGPEVSLRVDANGGWSVSEAVALIGSLAEIGVEAVEQPVSGDDIEGLAEVTRRVSPLVLADESVCTPAQARTLIKKRAVGGFNLRLSKCGGPARTLQLLNLARQAGLPYQLGCQVGELGLLSAAGRHLALAQPGFTYLEGALTGFVLDKDIIAEDITFGYGGKLEALTEPGLGVGVVESRLAESIKYTLY